MLIQHSKPFITESDVNAVHDTLSSGLISSGARTKKFENKLAEYFCVPDVITVGSGTAAIQLALLAFGIKVGDEVILPTYVCHTVLDAVLSTGATPVLCDVGASWNMTASNIEGLVSEKTKAIIVVHIFGICADTLSFVKFNIPIIEDCCQAFGLESNGVKVGTIGDIGVYSFHATKCLTTAEGGLAISKKSDLINAMKLIKLERALPSLSDLQSALGISQLDNYPNFLIRRKQIADSYYTRLADLNIVPDSSLVHRSIFFRFPVIIKNDLQRYYFDKLNNCNINVRKGVDALLHRLHKLPDAPFINATKLFNSTLSLPIYPAMLDREVDYVIDTINNLRR